MKSYNEIGEREDDSITNSYSGYNEKLWSYNEKYKREWERVGTIGLDWLGRGWRTIGLVVGR